MKRLYKSGSALAIGVAFMLPLGNAQAVPSFARQTGMTCAVCHRTNYPELTSFGRNFKLNGYTLAGAKQIEATSELNKRGLKIDDPAPLSAMLITSLTQLTNSGGAQNNAIEFPQQFSLFYAGEITPNMGSFLQLTYAMADGSFGWDNSDIRYANHTSGGTTYGFDFNNGPTIQDLWNSSAAWGFPYTGSDAANSPATSAMLNGDMLAQDSGGLGAYAMWGGSLYTEVTLYKSTHQGTASPTDVSNPVDPAYNPEQNTLNGFTPYIRIAYTKDSGDNNWMVGAYSMAAKIYPGGTVSGATDDYNDTAVDTQWQSKSFSAHATYLVEKRTFNASGGSGTLNTTKLDGTYFMGEKTAATVAYVSTAGTGGGATVWDGNASPDSAVTTLQLTYVPYQNLKFGAQYNMYSKFDGSTAGASDNNNLYLMAWMMF